MIFIDEIVATEVMDSRGNPTVRVTVSLSDGILKVLLYQVVQVPVNVKHWNYVMAVPVTWGKVFYKLVKMSMDLSPMHWLDLVHLTKQRLILL